MWLLSTDRAELSFFASPELVPGGYAILSHVWDDVEMSFHDLVALCAECALTRTNPRTRVPRKIRKACALARRHGDDPRWRRAQEQTERIARLISEDHVRPLLVHATAR